MTAKRFVDTNYLVYCVDAHAPTKQKRCRELLWQYSQEGNLIISTQVLQEFSVVALRKMELKPAVVKEMVRGFGCMETVLIDPTMIQDAIDCSQMHQLSFWDALIVVSAEKARCSEIWTEDLNTGQVIRGIRITNPLAEVQ